MSTREVRDLVDGVELSAPTILPGTQGEAKWLYTRVCSGCLAEAGWFGS